MFSNKKNIITVGPGHFSKRDTSLKVQNSTKYLKDTNKEKNKPECLHYQIKKGNVQIKSQLNKNCVSRNIPCGNIHSCNQLQVYNVGDNEKLKYDTSSSDENFENDQLFAKNFKVLKPVDSYLEQEKLLNYTQKPFYRLLDDYGNVENEFEKRLIYSTSNQIPPILSRQHMPNEELNSLNNKHPILEQQFRLSKNIYCNQNCQIISETLPFKCLRKVKSHYDDYNMHQGSAIHHLKKYACLTKVIKSKSTLPIELEHYNLNTAASINNVLYQQIPNWLKVYFYADFSKDHILKFQIFNLLELNSFDRMLKVLYEKELEYMIGFYQQYKKCLESEIRHRVTLALSSD